MLFSDPSRLLPYFEGKRVAIVGSGPGALENTPGFIDGHDVVVRVNNYGTADAVPPGQDWKGLDFRCDVFYSFFGGSIKKGREDLISDGVRLCMCKCPNSKFIESEWHRANNKPHGVDFRYIYRDRADFWFCPTYVPPLEELMATFDLLQKHIPSTGFSALVAVRAQRPASIYLTGFDFFSSRVHNVAEPWRPGNPNDPIGHAPERERSWLRWLLHRNEETEITLDPRLTTIMENEDAA